MLAVQNLAVESVQTNLLSKVTRYTCHNAEVKSVQTSSVIDMKTFDTSASINLKPPPIDRHKSFDDNEFSKKPTIVKKVVAAPADVQSYSIADLQIATGSFSVDHLVGEGSFGRVYRAQFDDGKVFHICYSCNSTLCLIPVAKISFSRIVSCYYVIFLGMGSNLSSINTQTYGCMHI